MARKYRLVCQLVAILLYFWSACGVQTLALTFALLHELGRALKMVGPSILNVEMVIQLVCSDVIMLVLTRLPASYGSDEMCGLLAVIALLSLFEWADLLLGR